MKLQMKEARKAKGLKQSEVADIIGCEQVSISFYEIGKRQPSLETLCQIADLYETSIDYLLGRTSVKEPYPAASETQAKPEPSSDHDKIMSVLKDTGLLDLLEAARKIGFTPQNQADAK